MNGPAVEEVFHPVNEAERKALTIGAAFEGASGILAGKFVGDGFQRPRLEERIGIEEEEEFALGGSPRLAAPSPLSERTMRRWQLSSAMAAVRSVQPLAMTMISK